MKTWLQTLSPPFMKDELQRIQHLLSTIFEPADIKPSDCIVAIIFHQLTAMYDRGVLIEWQLFDSKQITLDQNLIRRMSDLYPVVSPFPRSNMAKTTKYQNHNWIEIALCEPLFLRFDGDKLIMLRLVLFVLFANRLYCKKSTPIRPNDFNHFRRFVAKPRYFDVINQEQIETQVQFEQAYHAFRSSINGSHDLKAKLFASKPPLLKKISVDNEPQKAAHQHKITLRDLDARSTYRQQVASEISSRLDVPVIVSQLTPTDTLDSIAQDLLHNNRLELMESLHLPLHSHYLREDEAKQLLHYLEQQLQHKSSKAALNAAIVLLALLTGKEDEALTSLSMSRRVQNEREYIDLERQCWNKPNIVLRDQFQPTDEQQSWVTSSCCWLALPLPRTLIEVFKFHLGVQNKSIVPLSILLTEPIAVLIKHALSQVSTNRPLTLAQVKRFMFSRLAQHYDPQFAMLLLSTVKLDNSHHLYYLAVSPEQLIRAYASEINRCMLDDNINIDTVITGLSKEEMYGSKNTLLIDRVYQRIQHCFSQLKTLSGSFPHEKSALITLFNDLNCYTGLMAVAASNHRIRVHYMFTENSFDCEQGVILVSDKVHYNDSAIRLLPMPDCLQQQLIIFKFYRNKIIQALVCCDPGLAKRLKSIDFQYGFFYSISPEQNIVPLGHKHLKAYLGNDWCLPLNTFRHHYCQTLRNDPNVAKFAKSLMGHVNHGQHVLSDFSNLSIDTIIQAKPVSNDLMAILGFSVLPAINKKRTSLSVSRIPLSSASNKEFSRHLVREKIDACLCDDKAIALDGLQKYVFDALINSLKDIPNTANHRRLILTFNRYFHKLYYFNHQQCTQHFDITTDLDVDGLTLSSLCLKQSSNHQMILSLLRNLLETKQVQQDPEIYILLSLLTFSPVIAGISITMLIQALHEPRFCVVDDHWYLPFPDNRRWYIDPMSIAILLAGQQPHPFIDKKRLIVKVNTLLRRILHNYDISSYDDALQILVACREYVLPSEVNAFKAGRLVSYPLSDATLCRFLTNRQYEVTRSLQPHCNLMSQKAITHQDILNCQQALGSIHSRLKKLPTSPTKKQLGEAILEAWRSLLNEPSTTGINRLREHTQATYNTAISLCFDYLFLRTQMKGKRKANAAKSTIIQYRDSAVLPFIHTFGMSDIEYFDAEEFEDMYRYILSSHITASRRYKAERFRDLHYQTRYLYPLPHLRWHQIEPSLVDDKTIINNANIVTMQDYDLTLAYIQHDQQLTATQKAYYQLTLILMMRLGLRPHEVWGLEYNDFTQNGEYLYIHSNAIRRLKTCAANRQVPVTLFLNDSEKKLLDTWKGFAQNRGTNKRIFYFIHQDHEDEQHRCQHYLTRCLKQISKDATLTLYHARHSFATHLYWLLQPQTTPSMITLQLQRWSRHQDLPQFREELMLHLVGNINESQKVFFALAKMVGHRHPSTTFASYIHGVDIQHCIDHNRHLYSMITTTERQRLCQLVALSSGTLRKRLRTEKAVDSKYARSLSHLTVKARYQLPSTPYELPINLPCQQLRSAEMRLDTLLTLNSYLHNIIRLNYYQPEGLSIPLFEQITDLTDSLRMAVLEHAPTSNKHTRMSNQISANGLLNYANKACVLELLNALSLLSNDEIKVLLATFTTIHYRNGIYTHEMGQTEAIAQFARKLGIKYRIKAEIKIHDFTMSKTVSELSFYRQKGMTSINKKVAYVFIIVALYQKKAMPVFAM